MSRERTELAEGWELAGTDPDARSSPADVDGLDWRPAAVPGTVAGALADDDVDGDGRDWWFRVAFSASPGQPGEQVVLGLDGLATVAEVYLNGERVLESDSMFAAHELEVGDRLRGENTLEICCRALTPRLQGRRRPRARWRTKLVATPNLRFYRTTLLGRAPGFSPRPAIVGPWRPVWLERRTGVLLRGARLRARLQDAAGILCARAELYALPGATLPKRLTLICDGGQGEHAIDADVTTGADGSATLTAALRIADPELWWPHTHGRPALYNVRVTGADGDLHQARMGFRAVRAAADMIAEGPALRINGEPIFARGAVWTPVSLRAPCAGEAQLRPILERVTSAGMNMLRLGGFGIYENAAFWDLCDELGILVWQDFMFANLDYPGTDPAFAAVVREEAQAVLAQVAGRPSLALLCGNSEVAQQVAMLGLDPALANDPIYDAVLPEAARDAEADVPYVPSSPWGGDRAFRPDRGIAHYYGVGAYLRPLHDARRAEVRFAAESLALANVPDDEALESFVGPGGLIVQGPAWKGGMTRDSGVSWDFEDVRDHYLHDLFGLDPLQQRYIDPHRYLELSRAVSGEVMAETMGEWRRAASPCRGALVLWLKDLLPGAGWGVLDHRGEPKVAWRHLARALAPVAVWSTDEGLAGIGVHVANDRAQPLAARLRVALYRDGEVRVDEAIVALELGPHAHYASDVETILGHFVDVSWAYRFGPPAQDLVVVSLERGAEDQPAQLISQAFRFPVQRPLVQLPRDLLGLRGRLSVGDDGSPALTVASSRFAYGVRVHVPGYRVCDDAFGIEPGHERVLALTAVERPGDASPAAGSLSALNLLGEVALLVDEQGRH